MQGKDTLGRQAIIIDKNANLKLTILSNQRKMEAKGIDFAKGKASLKLKWLETIKI